MSSSNGTEAGPSSSRSICNANRSRPNRAASSIDNVDTRTCTGRSITPRALSTSGTTSPATGTTAAPAGFAAAASPAAVAGGTVVVDGTVVAGTIVVEGTDVVVVDDVSGALVEVEGTVVVEGTAVVVVDGVEVVNGTAAGASRTPRATTLTRSGNRTDTTDRPTGSRWPGAANDTVASSGTTSRRAGSTGGSVIGPADSTFGSGIGNSRSGPTGTGGVDPDGTGAGTSWASATTGTNTNTDAHTASATTNPNNRRPRNVATMTPPKDSTHLPAYFGVSANDLERSPEPNDPCT